MSAPFLVLPFILLFVYWYFDLLPGMTPFMATIFAFWAIFLIYLLYREGDREDEHFENSPAWHSLDTV